MKSATQLTTLRSDTEQHARSTVELSAMRSPFRDPPLNSNGPTEAHFQTWHDEKSNGIAFWKKFQPFPWRSFFAISSLPLALAPIIVLATAAEEASVSYILIRDCYPNGLWKEATGATWRIMDSSYFFTPNLSFGAMTFTQVKIIDVAWDLLIGRGGQVLLAYVNYRVFNEWLLFHMEMYLTSYKMYTAMAFQTTSLPTLGVLGKEFLAFGEKSWKRFFRWLAVLSMLISTLYVLAFPTLMAAMTGYITTYEAYVQDYNGNLIEWEKVNPVLYIIQDSERIGDYSKPLVVTGADADADLVAAIENYIATYYDQRSTSHATLPTFFTNTSTVFIFSDTTSTLIPSLNITISSIDVPEDFVSPGLHNYFYSLESGRQAALYNASYIHSHGSCKPSETYQWGFSYIFLFMVSIFNFVWICVTVGMWFDTSRASRMYKSGRRPGLLRSIMDLSGAIREEFSEEDVDKMGEEELRKGLRRSGGALVVPGRELRVSRADTGDRARRRGWKSKMTMGSTF